MPIVGIGNLVSRNSIELESVDRLLNLDVVNLSTLHSRLVADSVEIAIGVVILKITRRCCKALHHSEK